MYRSKKKQGLPRTSSRYAVKPPRPLIGVRYAWLDQHVCFKRLGYITSLGDCKSPRTHDFIFQAVFTFMHSEWGLEIDGLESGRFFDPQKWVRNRQSGGGIENGSEGQKKVENGRFYKNPMPPLGFVKNVKKGCTQVLTFLTTFSGGVKSERNRGSKKGPKTGLISLYILVWESCIKVTDGRPIFGPSLFIVSFQTKSVATLTFFRGSVFLPPPDPFRDPPPKRVSGRFFDP